MPSGVGSISAAGGAPAARSPTISDGLRGWSIAANPFPIMTVNGNGGGGYTDSNSTPVTNASQTCRYPITFVDDYFDVRVVVGNFVWADDLNLFSGPIASKTFSGNPVNVAVALESPTGTIYPLTFGGVSVYALQPGELALSDPLPVNVVAGSVWKIRYYNGVPDGGFAWITFNQGFGYQGKYGLSNQTTAATAYFTGTTDSPRPIMPCAVVGQSLNPGAQVPSLAVIGDSITYGVGDPGGTGGGWFRRAFPNTNGVWFDVAQGQAAKYRAFRPGHKRILGPMLSLCDYALIALGTNDLTAHISTNHDATAVAAEIAIIKQSMVSIAQECQSYGCRPIAVLPFPLNTAATAAANPGYQTGRHAYNTFLRTVPAPFIGVIDPSAALEAAPVDTSSTVGSGQWLASLLSDGSTDPIHPGPVRCAAAAATILAQFNQLVALQIQY